MALCLLSQSREAVRDLQGLNTGVGGHAAVFTHRRQILVLLLLRVFGSRLSGGSFQGRFANSLKNRAALSSVFSSVGAGNIWFPCDKPVLPVTWCSFYIAHFGQRGINPSSLVWFLGSLQTLSGVWELVLSSFEDVRTLSGTMQPGRTCM